MTVSKYLEGRRKRDEREEQLNLAAMKVTRYVAWMTYAVNTKPGNRKGPESLLRFPDEVKKKLKTGLTMEEHKALHFKAVKKWKELEDGKSSSNSKSRGDVKQRKVYKGSKASK